MEISLKDEHKVRVIDPVQVVQLYLKCRWNAREAHFRIWLEDPPVPAPPDESYVPRFKRSTTASRAKRAHKE